MTELDKLQTDLLKLPTELRAWLARVLIQSLDEPADEDLEASWVTEIKRRDAAFKEGKATAKPAEQVLREAREKLR